MSRNRSNTLDVSSTVISTISSTGSSMMMKIDDDDQDKTKSAAKKTSSLENISIQRLSQPSPMSTNSDTKRSPAFLQPKGTTVYTVEDRDTLEKVALHFNSTPSELQRLNKLSTRMIFPGQTLYVPDKSVLNDVSSNSAETKSRSSSDNVPPLSEMAAKSPVWSMKRLIPGRAQRIGSQSSTESVTSDKLNETDAKDGTTTPTKLSSRKSSTADHSSDDELSQGFIKLHVRLIKEDRKTIPGVLLVTPKVILFDPDASDPHLIEQTVMSSGVIINIEYLASISLYSDLADYDHQVNIRDEERRQTCYSISVKNRLHLSQLTESIGEQRIPELITCEENKSEQLTDQILSITENICTTEETTSNNEQTQSNTNENDLLADPTDFVGSLNEYKHSVGILSSDLSSDTVHSNVDRVESQSSIVFDLQRFQRAVQAGQNSIENQFSSQPLNVNLNQISEILHHQQENCSPSHPIEIPYYLCLKTSIHIHDLPSLEARQYKNANEKALDFAHGRKQVQHEYWFSVPKERTEILCKFFLRWQPHYKENALKDDDDQLSSQLTQPSSSNEGFVLLVNDDPELTSDGSEWMTDNNPDNVNLKKPHYLRRQRSLLKGWEIISVDEIYRRFNPTTFSSQRSYEFDVTLPKLLQPSKLIDDQQVKQILLQLPARVQASDWCLLFSTELHGFSLSQLYRRSYEIERDNPSLLIIRDIDQNIFGAFASHALLISEGFYGNGESFLFTFYPAFRAFNWSGTNDYFVKGDTQSIGFGSADGHYALWLDGDLYRGRTCFTRTFRNDPLTTKEDFLVSSVELWTFIDQSS